MTDRENVIKGLQEAVDFLATETSLTIVDQWVVRDALALLKEQEPHIVTIADYENNPNVDKDGNLAVWRESRHYPGIAYHEDGWIVLNRNMVEGWFNSEVIRFWTSRPTDEQRQAVKWK